ncbi:efflux RND transporter periplasmic adaptor subunit [Granulicella cerasi]|uniref:Efflux RND transporter periplasmic adaptor subunit n=1 Tax=Granulicella cerasi TaxID=741063 RepID=A0ABW1Z9Y9_9BACT|nr:efflux RND transporter periplasmic adaptor subunit [Granulicella cerasi]
MSNEQNMHDDEKKLPWPEETDPAKVGEAFADPNSLDDRRVGHNFEDANSSAKKHHKPLREEIHPPKNRRPLYVGIFLFVVLFLIVLLIGGIPRLLRNHEIDKRAKDEKNDKPIVDVVQIKHDTAANGLSLPGTSIPLNQAYVYARASGYLRNYKVDIGDHVKKGQLLAVIDAPDLDAQVAQAREQLQQAQQQYENQKAQLALDTVTVERYRVLVKKGVFSRQQGDQQEAAYSQSLANVAAAARNINAFRANLQRIVALQEYENVRAPFDGVVTQRNVDTGALISAGGSASGAASSAPPVGQNSSAGGTSQAASSNNGGSSGSGSTAATSAQSPGQGGPLFTIAQVQRLRVLVSVPEGYAPAVHVGTKAKCTFQEFPDRIFEGDVTRTASSIDQNTRTMLTEVQVDNSQGKLLSGMYVIATFPPVSGAQTPLMVPGEAIIIRKDRSMVAVVKDGKIRMTPIVIGRDLGTAVEVLGGLNDGDLVVATVTDDVTDGREVKVHQNNSTEQKALTPQPTKPQSNNSQYGNQGLVNNGVEGQEQQQQQGQQGKGKSGQQSEAKP